jgi:SPP1 gp7 family putative phage head morphogenesis protein
MAKHILWDGQKSVDLDQYPPQAWNNLGGQTSDTGNDSREDRAAAGKFYETVAVLYRCVTLRQVGISRVPWVITRNGKDIWLDEDPMPPAQLAYLTDFRRLLRLTEAALCLSPEAFWFVERNRVKPLSLRWHSPSSIIPQWREADGLVGFKRILSQGHFKMFEPADYVYFALPNPLHETIPGRPAAQAALAAAGLLYAIDAFGSAFISRGAIKATLLTAPVGTSPTERDRLRAWWRRAFGGIGNAFGTEVISSEVKPVIVGEGLEQLNNGELTRAKQEEIATSLGVPHSLVFSNAANFATASKDDVHFYDKTVIPSFSFLAEVLNEQLLGPQGFALELRPESMSIYQEDEKERAASVGVLVQAGMSLVLALEILGYDLTDEQWAQMKEIPEPVAPSAPVVPVVPVPTPGADIITEANNVLEKATFRRWAARRKNPNPDAFRSDILTTADKTAVLAEMMEDADGGTLPPFLPRGGAHTHKATNPATPDPEAELRKRESAERKAAKEIAAGLKKQQAAVVSAIGENGNVSAAEQAITESHTTATEALRRALIAGTDLGTSYAIAGLESTGFGMDWTLANTEAQQWAEQHAGQLIKDIDATSLDRVRSAVASWVESGAPLSSLIDELAPTFGPNRASLIATTELTRSYAEGSRQIYKASGVVTSWRWETANDNLVCPICGPLNGKVVKIDAPFNVHLPAGMKVDTFDAPPSHVNCRCGVSGVIEAVQPRQPAPERVEAGTVAPTSNDVGMKVRSNLLSENAKVNQQKLLSLELDSINSEREQILQIQRSARTDLQKNKLRELEEKYQTTFERYATAPAGENLSIEQQRKLLAVDAPSRVSVDIVGELSDIERKRLKDSTDFIESISSNLDVKTKINQTNTGTQRAFYNEQTNTVVLQTYNRDISSLHELGHAIEKDSGEAFWEYRKKFYDSRTQGDELQRLYRGNDTELYKKDKWSDPYMGKVYSGTESASELISMGLEELYNNPLKFAESDPDFFDFVISYLRR